MSALLPSRRGPLFGGAALVLAAALAYANSLHGPFVFDDISAIRDNVTIRHFWSALSPPPGALPVSGRPVVNLSLALNYALGGLAVGGYHAFNLLVHILAGLTLFGILRRTLPAASAVLAWAIALLWILHPLDTESVTYVSQRAESLMGFLYLLTLYGFVRAAGGPEEAAPTAARAGGRGWFMVSGLACAAGMVTKEVMVSAPLMVLLYDRTFLSPGFAAAWRRRRAFYIGLASTWLVLVLSVVNAGATRGGTSGLAVGATWLPYELTQFAALARYLKLSFWPAPLVFYYESFSVRWDAILGLEALLVLGLAAGTLWAVARRRAAGFLGVWFFAILAPTSLVPNAIQMIAEHRMYLPLAAVLTAAVLGLAALMGRKASLVVCGVAAVVLAFATVRRNQVYRTSESLWADTAAQRPDNAFARNNLGEALAEQGSFAEAVEQYRAALRVDPGPASIYAYLNLGEALDRMGHSDEALAIERQAVRLQPDWASTHTGLADILNHAQRWREAEGEYEAALRLKPGAPRAENGLGYVLFRSGRPTAAVAHFQAALRAKPDWAEAQGNLAAAWFSLNRGPEAIAAYERAVQLEPDNAEIHLSLGNVFYQADRPADAVREYASALRLRPQPAETHDHYGILLAEVGRLEDAAAQFTEAVRLQPDDRTAQDHLRGVRQEIARRAGLGR